MSDRDQTTGEERCGCGRKAEPGRECCAACQHGELPDEPHNTASAIKAHEDTAAYLMKLARMAGHGELRRCLDQSIAYHNRRAAELAGLPKGVA